MVSTTYQLTMRSGPTPGKIYPIDKDEVLIGRDLANDVVVNDASVSRRHAHLVMQEGGYVLEDLGSTNGTLVDGQRLMVPYHLQSGEIFTLGETVAMVFEAITYDPDATIASPRMGMAQPAPAAQPYQPVQPVEPPAAPPPQPAPAPQVYSTPAYVPPQAAVPPQPQPQYQPQPQPQPVQPQQPVQPVYSGQVPSGPASVPAKKKKKFPVWLIIVLVIILLVVCLCVVSLYIIDANKLWCTVFPFLNSLGFTCQ